MTSASGPAFPPPGTPAEIERGSVFTPKFGPDGLIPVVATSAATGELLMVAWMNPDALRLTIQTGEAHFWSRSRKRIWKKGEDSGNVLRISDIRVDCDQDCLWLKVTVAGAGVACHTGERSCFYRSVDLATEPGAQIRLKSA